MKIRDIEIGKKVRVKEFKNRPCHWNYKGAMDKWMGKTVTIRFYSHNKLHVEENKWSWQPSDFYQNCGFLSDDLFEI